VTSSGRPFNSNPEQTFESGDRVKLFLITPLVRETCELAGTVVRRCEPYDRHYLVELDDYGTVAVNAVDIRHLTVIEMAADLLNEPSGKIK